MWKYLQEKLGIKSRHDDFEYIDCKLYTLITLISECNANLETLNNKIIEISLKLENLESKVKAIPKEIVIKNVLSI